MGISERAAGLVLEGRTALVTGGNGGIGLAMALGLQKAGASVVIAGRNAQKGAAALKALTHGEARFIQADLSDPTGCERLVDAAARDLGGLDILINNAGITVRKRPESLSFEEWELVLRTNLTSAFLCSQAAHPLMKARHGGKIINLGSMLSIVGAPFAAAYAASKGGIVQLTRSLATAWAEDGIQVNAVLPGWVDTEMGASARQQVEGLDARVLARTPAKRWGRAEDFEGVAVFLASAASDFITGIALPIDGGYSVSG
jgi:2-dehydro-3-deoxy-D-gluconate 5-dehydrogenase